MELEILACNTNRDRRNIFSRLSSFLKQPFFEQKYIILTKFIRIFCDWAYISKRTLKVATTNFFFKVGYLSAPLTGKEIKNINEVKLTGFEKYLLPFKVFKFCGIGIIRYPIANIKDQITDIEMFDLARNLSIFSVRRKVNVMELAYTKEFLTNNPTWYEDQQFLRKMELSTLCGPIHGDFDRTNIVRYDNELRLIDFDNFELDGIHYFDFLSAFCFQEDVFGAYATWFDFFSHMLDRWDTLEFHEYWSELTLNDKRAILYLFVIWRWYKDVLIPKSDTSDYMIKDILKQIRNLPIHG